MNELRKRKAISPVIATVILVAVAITVSVAVSYWMGSIASQYTKFEKVEIQSGYSVKTAVVPAGVGPDGLLGTSDDIPAILGGWTITLELKNSGSATANLIKTFVNDKPVDVVGAGGFTLAPIVGPTLTGSSIPVAGALMESGQSAIVKVYIGSAQFSSGTTINIKLHSAGGMDYIKLIELV